MSVPGWLETQRNRSFSRKNMELEGSARNTEEREEADSNPLKYLECARINLSPTIKNNLGVLVSLNRFQ